MVSLLVEYGGAARSVTPIYSTSERFVLGGVTRVVLEHARHLQKLGN